MKKVNVMKSYKKQTQKSVSSFEWQWVEKKVRDSRKNFYRRLSDQWDKVNARRFDRGCV